MRHLEDLLSAPPDLPVVSALGALARACESGAALVVTAPPGTGKTTLLPPAVACALTSPGRGRVLVTQPRRVAVRAAARRIASLLGEGVGGHVGYSVRGDSRVSAATRVEMVTPGVLLRRLHADPELPGVAGVVLDEFHERDLDTDLALAFLLDVRQALRDDLVVAVASATLEADRVRSLLESAVGRAPARIDVPGVLHPLTVRWEPPPRGAEPLGPVGDGRIGVRREFLGHVARSVVSHLGDSSGDVLVFVPGAAEIERVCALLDGVDADVLPLHGSLPARAQDEALAPGRRRRIVVSTAVAESSLTVAGVDLVVDACLAREPRLDAARGVSRLVTVPASRARLDQRAGRAARLGPGTAVRLIDEADWARRPAQSEPAIRVADLTGLRLQSAAWGAPDCSGLALLDPPPAGAFESAGARLRSIGAIDAAGAATRLGRRLARFPLDPPLARALVDAAPVLGARRACRVVALLGADLRSPGADLAALDRRLDEARDPDSRRVRDDARRLEALLGSEPAASTGAGARVAAGREESLGLVAALARPDWIARRRPGSTSYLLAQGVGADLPAASPLEGQEWLAVASLDRTGGARQARILSAAPLDEVAALEAGAPLLVDESRARVVDGRVRATRERRLGAIPLASRDAGRVGADEAVCLVLDALRADGLDALGWSAPARSLRERMAALHRAVGAPWPAVDDEALLARADEWLAPRGPDLGRGARLDSVSMLDALRALMPWPQASRLDELAPESLEIPAGGRRPVDWSSGTPALSLRVQQAFGWTRAPVLADGALPLVLHLTDPAGRPVAVTSDLESFWGEPYRQVRAQLRGRYPKHPWPEDPLSATPTSRAKPRR
ncbi:ATP-dependent helicase HrpB [Actinomyces sp. B33]|uniref:ATP-dependent helicase HrpB n=1 Tax=Actinomyces sp. B33 TaxID=2942131 RepID=UPI0023402D85|nr:ATP-dependent helicase HrpB [Actinomyces sp. B33]MDC4232721.1 ATP-dependent helicase HrpB [Actinomyces sp. B33]